MVGRSQSCSRENRRLTKSGSWAHTYSPSVTPAESQAAKGGGLDINWWGWLLPVPRVGKGTSGHLGDFGRCAVLPRRIMAYSVQCVFSHATQSVPLRGTTKGPGGIWRWNGDMPFGPHRCPWPLSISPRLTKLACQCPYREIPSPKCEYDCSTAFFRTCKPHTGEQAEAQRLAPGTASQAYPWLGHRATRADGTTIGRREVTGRAQELERPFGTSDHCWCVSQTWANPERV
jgi:hypothetical protein